MSATRLPRESRAQWDLSKRNAKPLTLPQKKALLIVARQAYQRAKSMHAADTDFDNWKREQAIKAAGVRISEATNGDFLKLRGHFHALAGNAGEAFNDALADDPETQRQTNARHVLNELLAKAGMTEAYAASICRDRFAVSLHHADAAQLEALAMTLKQRAAAFKAREKAKQEVQAAQPTAS